MKQISDTAESVVWSGRPHQIVNLKIFIICGLLCWLVVPIFYAMWHWLAVRNIEYSQTPERLRIRHGVLNKVSDDVELYRVKDFQVQEPLHLRLFGLSNVVLLTSDKLQPRVTLRAIEDGLEVKDFIREHVEYMRQKRGVRQFD